MFINVTTIIHCWIDQTNFCCPLDLWYPDTKPEVSMLQEISQQWSTYQIPRNGWQIPFSLTLSYICPASLSAHSSCIEFDHIAFSLLGWHAPLPPSSHIPTWMSECPGRVVQISRYPLGCLVLPHAKHSFYSRYVSKGRIHTAVGSYEKVHADSTTYFIKKCCCITYFF